MDKSSGSRRFQRRLLNGGIGATLAGGALGALGALGGCAAPQRGASADMRTGSTGDARPLPPAEGAPDPKAVATFGALLAGAHRLPTNVARDPHRHPAQTLAFFGIRSDSVVVEILPGSSGYYMELLAPYLRDKGQYVAAGRDPSAPAAYLADHRKMLARLSAEPALYGRVKVTQFLADRHPIAEAGSADYVLTFRNLHNWMERGEADGALRAFHRALKPGGQLGVVDHRGRTDQSQAQQMKNGYVREDVAIALIEKAGFRLGGRSEVNANPKDSKDHPEGVWTLPPTYRLKDVDRAKYQAIGESDRFTLKFTKI